MSLGVTCVLILFFLIFYSVTILNKQLLIDIQTISISLQTFCDQGFATSKKYYILQHRHVTHFFRRCLHCKLSILV